MACSSPGDCASATGIGAPSPAVLAGAPRAHGGQRTRCSQIVQDREAITRGLLVFLDRLKRARLADPLPEALMALIASKAGFASPPPVVELSITISASGWQAEQVGI